MMALRLGAWALAACGGAVEATGVPDTKSSGGQTAPADAAPAFGASPDVVRACAGLPLPAGGLPCVVVGGVCIVPNCPPPAACMGVPLSPPFCDFCDDKLYCPHYVVLDGGCGVELCPPDIGACEQGGSCPTGAGCTVTDAFGCVTVCSCNGTLACATTCPEFDAGADG